MSTSATVPEYKLTILKQLLGACRIVFCVVRGASRTGRHTTVAAFIAGGPESPDEDGSDSVTVISSTLAAALGLDYDDARKGFVVHGDPRNVLYEKIRVLSRQLYGRDAALGVRWL